MSRRSVSHLGPAEGPGEHALAPDRPRMKRGGLSDMRRGPRIVLENFRPEEYRLVSTAVFMAKMLFACNPDAETLCYRLVRATQHADWKQSVELDAVRILISKTRWGLIARPLDEPDEEGNENYFNLVYLDPSDPLRQPQAYQEQGAEIEEDDDGQPDTE